MRIRTSLALGLLLVLTAAGCAKATGGDDGVASAGDGKASPAATATASSGGRRDRQADQDAMLKFAQCMREHGIPMDDPQFEGNGVSITMPDGVDKAKVDAAQAECKQFMPNGGEPPKMDPADQERLRKFAQCMRDQGITNFPDPGENGFMIDGNQLGIDPQGEQFKAAERACEQYRPKGTGGDDEPGTNGGGA